MSRRAVLPILIIALLGVGMFFALRTARNPPFAAPPATPHPVVTELVRRGEVREVFEALGTTRAGREAELSSEMTGRVAFLAPAGTRLASGQAVARLDPVQPAAGAEAARARLRTAEVDLQKAERNLDRTRRLVEAGAQSRQALDDAEAARDGARHGLAAAHAMLVDAQASLGKSVVAAPFRGEVLSTHVEAGEIVAPGATIARFGDLSTIEVEVTVGERGAVAAAVGAEAVVSFDALRGDSRVTRVKRFDRALSPDARTAKVVLELPNPSQSLLAGMIVRVVLSGRNAPDALSVPKSAVQHEPDGTYVWIAERGKAARRRVATGIEGADRTEILTGLREGELVIIRGAEALIEGSPVDATAAPDPP